MTQHGPDIDVAVIGGGPAGLGAAIALRRCGVQRVVLFEREQAAGGIPRHTEHLGFILRRGDRQRPARITTGGRYAHTLVAEASRVGVEIRLQTTVRSFAESLIMTTSEGGTQFVQARATVLATGVRERSRAARLVAGDRPAGVLTTAAVQQFDALHHQQVGRRAVIVGAEHVSYSAVMTLRHNGCQVVAMVTDHARHQTYHPLALLATRCRVPLITAAMVVDIHGRRRVEAVTLNTGRRIECDTVVFTGDWVPDNELARSADLDMVPARRGPLIDDRFQTSRPGVFAIGNLVHPAETADVCYRDGVAAAAVGGQLAQRPRRLDGADLARS